MSAARDKGRQGERELAELFKGKRTPLSGALPGDADVELPPPFDGLHVEVKRRAHVPLLARQALEQAKAAMPIGSPRYPMAAIKEDRGRWMVAMWADDFRQYVSAQAEVGQAHRLKAYLRQIERTAREARGAM